MHKRALLIALPAVLGIGAWFAWNALEPPAPEVPIAVIDDPAPFLRATDCFASFPTYDAWREFIRGKNGRWNPKLLLVWHKFPRAQFERTQRELDCRMVAYDSDGLKVGGFMLAPKAAGHGKLPVIVYNRGGNGSFGAITFAAAMDHLAPFAHEGFIVLASQYRGANDSTGADKDEFGGRDVNDVAALVALAKRLPNADADNAFMVGASRGGMMSFMTARRTDGIRAMAVMAGVSDLRRDFARDPRMEPVYRHRIPGYPATRDAAFAERSVMAWADALPRDMPVLLLHGERDERVHVEQARLLHAELDRLGHPNRVVVYPGDDHRLSAHRDEAVAEVVDWFRTAMRTPAGDIGATAAAP